MSLSKPSDLDLADQLPGERLIIIAELFLKVFPSSSGLISPKKPQVKLSGLRPDRFSDAWLQQSRRQGTKIAV